MNKIAFTGCVLIAFCALQFVNSLSCYTCYSPEECKKARVITCNEVSANETRRELEHYHRNVPNITSNIYECLSLTYKWYSGYSNLIRSNISIFGCVYKDLNSCSLIAAPEISSHNARYCYNCHYDKCNGNPAGKLSSSVYTIAATVVALMLAKAYA